MADDAIRYGQLLVYKQSSQGQSLSDDINHCTTRSPIKVENEATPCTSTNHAGHEDEELLAEGILSARHD